MGAHSYLFKLPSPQSDDGVISSRVTRVFAPDGTELPFVLGIKFEAESDNFVVAYIKVHARFSDVHQGD